MNFLNIFSAPVESGRKALCLQGSEKKLLVKAVKHYGVQEEDNSNVIDSEPLEVLYQRLESICRGSDFKPADLLSYVQYIQ